MDAINLVNPKNSIVFGNDSVVIQKFGGGLKGGRVLDVTGFKESIIKAGHVIITDGNGKYKPMPVADGAYSSIPEGFSVAGILYRTIETAKPAASIMFDGEVNIEAVPYPVTDLLTKIGTACPNIVFVKDEEFVTE